MTKSTFTREWPKFGHNPAREPNEVWAHQWKHRHKSASILQAFLHRLSENTKTAITFCKKKKFFFVIWAGYCVTFWDWHYVSNYVSRFTLPVHISQFVVIVRQGCRRLIWPYVCVKLTVNPQLAWRIVCTLTSKMYLDGGMDVIGWDVLF